MKHYDLSHFEIPEQNDLCNILTGIVSLGLIEIVGVLAGLGFWLVVWNLLP
jgi:hypothetical protein